MQIQTDAPRTATIFPLPSYADACAARIQAEAGSDAMLYYRAAHLFELLGMDAAAQRCNARGEHYQEVTR